MIELKQCIDKECYVENGYVIVNHAFSAEDLNAFKNCMQAIVRVALNKAMKNYPNMTPVAKGDELDLGLLVLKRIDARYISFVQRTISRTHEFFRLVSNPRNTEIMKELLGLTKHAPSYISSSGIIFNFPHDSQNKSSANIELDWHTDVFFTIPRSNFLHFWAPLIHNATEEIGTVRVCPGSHKEQMVKQNINLDTSYNHRYTVDPTVVAKYKPLSVEAKLGQLLIFARDLIHRSGVNTSELVRCSLVGLSHDATYDDFIPFTTEYKYSGQTPEAYFYEIFGDAKAKSIMYEQAVSPGEPRGGV